MDANQALKVQDFSAVTSTTNKQQDPKHTQ